MIFPKKHTQNESKWLKKESKTNQIWIDLFHSKNESLWIENELTNHMEITKNVIKGIKMNWKWIENGLNES